MTDSPGNQPSTLGVHNCIVDWPPQPWPAWANPQAPYYAPQPYYGQFTFTPAAPRLSDEDVERIARKVAEILKSA